jgi:hypothetical protein
MLADEQPHHQPGGSGGSKGRKPESQICQKTGAKSVAFCDDSLKPPLPANLLNALEIVHGGLSKGWAGGQSSCRRTISQAAVRELLDLPIVGDRTG